MQCAPRTVTKTLVGDPWNRSSPASWAWHASRSRWQAPPHLSLLNRRVLDRMAEPNARVIVTMPPRHGKSLLVSQYLPAWFLGKFPTKRVILASYGGEYAAHWGRRTRETLSENAGQFLVAVRGDSSAAHRWELEKTGGGMNTAGVGGAITGKGADLLLIDDPIKNAEQANSKRWREKTWEWCQSTAYTRLEPGGGVVVVLTRWHEDDLAGRLLRDADADGDSWEVINLPAISIGDDALERHDDDPLWPARYPTPRLEQVRRAVGAYHWSALYQQRPTPPSGAIFRREWFRTWRLIDDHYAMDGQLPVRADACWRFGTVDLAISQRASADFTVMLACAVTPSRCLLLLDCLRARLSGPEIVPALQEMTTRWQLDYLGVEQAGFQEAIIQQARRAGLATKALRPHGDKVSRAHAAATRFAAGDVFLPQQALWRQDFEEELLHFPHGVHDDQVDAVTYACMEVARRG